MKSEDEIQKAHDALVPVITGELDIDFPLKQLPQLVSACDVLCWVLEHNHNHTFQKNLDALLKEVDSIRFGIEERKPD